MALLAKHEPALRAYVRSLVPDWDLSDEVLQEASVSCGRNETNWKTQMILFFAQSCFAVQVSSTAEAYGDHCQLTNLNAMPGRLILYVQPHKVVPPRGSLSWSTPTISLPISNWSALLLAFVLIIASGALAQETQLKETPSQDAVPRRKISVSVLFETLNISKQTLGLVNAGAPDQPLDAFS